MSDTKIDPGYGFCLCSQSDPERTEWLIGSGNWRPCKADVPVCQGGYTHRKPIPAPDGRKFSAPDCEWELVPKGEIETDEMFYFSANANQKWNKNTCYSPPRTIDRNVSDGSILAFARRKAAKTALSVSALQGHDEPCYYCGKPCNSLAANPSEWPVLLCHADDPGKPKAHHIGCVSDRLHQSNWTYFSDRKTEAKDLPIEAAYVNQGKKSVTAFNSEPAGCYAWRSIGPLPEPRPEKSDEEKAWEKFSNGELIDEEGDLKRAYIFGYRAGKEAGK